MKRIRILIADDHEVLVLGLKTLFQRNDRFEVVGEAYSGTEAVTKAGLLKPEVVIMDIRMPGLGSIEACREIKQIGTQALVEAVETVSKGQYLAVGTEGS
jgi:DNA-binding NarL/FixJ family response regulator